MLDEAIHPEDVIILSFKLELIADEETKLLFCLVLELSQSLLEDGVKLLLDVGCFRVDFLDFQVDFAQIIGQLILAPFDIGIDFFDL